MIYHYKDPDETVNFSFDFSKVSDSVNTPVVTVSVAKGKDDAHPEDILQGEPSVQEGIVTQCLTGGQAGTVYRLRCTVFSGNETRLLESMLFVRRKEPV
jgi:hypothetical protein